MKNFNLSKAYFNHLSGEYNAQFYKHRQIEFYFRKFY